MCVLCHARKARSFANLLSKQTCNVVGGVESKVASANTFTSVRAYASAAVPQPKETASAPRVDGYVLHPSTINPNILKAQVSALTAMIGNKSPDFLELYILIDILDVLLAA